MGNDKIYLHTIHHNPIDIHSLRIYGQTVAYLVGLPVDSFSLA